METTIIDVIVIFIALGTILVNVGLAILVSSMYARVLHRFKEKEDVVTQKALATAPKAKKKSDSLRVYFSSPFLDQLSEKFTCPLVEALRGAQERDILDNSDCPGGNPWKKWEETEEDLNPESKEEKK